MTSPSQPDEGGKPAGGPPIFSQDVHHANVAARVPEKVARGVFSTGVVVLQWHTEFILDFVQQMGQPHQVTARVVVPVSLVPRLIAALRENLDNYARTFGPPPPLPTPAHPAKQPTIEEVYDGLKILDDSLSGVYANSAQMSHSASAFCFDFITDFYPKAAVSARVFLSAANVPVMLNSLAQSWQKYDAKVKQDQQQKPPTG